MTMTIKELTQKYEDATYKRLKAEHPDYEWNSYDEGYMAAIDVHIGCAYEQGCHDVLDVLEHELREYGEYDRMSVYWLRHVINQIKGKKDGEKQIDYRR